LHEERRLGYVALTRASENAIITFSKKRRIKNAWVDSSGPSRYLSLACLRLVFAVSLGLVVVFLPGNKSRSVVLREKK